MDDVNRKSEDDLPLEEQEELLLLMLEEEGLLSPVQQIMPISREGDLPVSFAQQRMWFLDQWKPGNPAYNIPLTLEVQGALERDVLERCLAEILQRHESLRTTFLVKDEQLFQVIRPVETFVLPYQDLSALPEEDRKNAVRRILREENLFHFNLKDGPLLRVLLLRLSTHEYRLLLNMHHIVSDGWSIGVLLQELTVLYRAFVQGQASPLPRLPIQYVDFAHWQKQWLQGDILDNQMNYWKKQLEDVTALELPTNHARPPEQTFNGAYESIFLTPTLTQMLKTLSQQEKVTLFTLMLASFQILLSRYTGQEDIALGTPVANRTRNEIAGLIGYFVNTLVLRSDLSGNPTFREVLQRVHKIAQEGYAHQDLPFERVVEVLQPERDLSHTPLFQVMMIQQNPSPLIEVTDNLTFYALIPESITAKFDLTLSIAEIDRCLQGMLEYNTDLFDAETITRMLAHWQTLLEGIVQHPEQRISDLPLLSDIEQNQVLTVWNATRTAFPALCVHQLFEAQAASTPDALALVCGQQRLTYRDLDQQANQLAHHLRALGVGPEVLVGIYIERSPEMLIGLLGILKAGGAYVPLDPIYPKERLAFMIADAQLPVLLTQQHLLAELPEHQARVVCLDADRALITSQSTTSPAVALQAEHLAYVIYTSGSTGKPKGVQVVHGALANFLQSMRHLPEISAQDRLLAVTTLSFDIAGLELYLPLLVGAQVILVSREVAADGVQLAEQIDTTSATIMQATPATWQLLLEAGWTGGPGLKALCGGEALPRQLARQLLKRTAALWNMYGPTETTIWSTAHEIDATDEVMAIGTPIANTQVYLLDRYLHPVPVGVTGDLYIGGTGLARGYLNRADLTAERFIPDPFSGRPGARLYRTGDLARYLANGKLECLGRSDNQVKIRGFRIELGEIETALVQHPAVRECAALVREDVPGDQRLVAYLVSEDQEGAVDKGLRAFLKETLPDYMIPAAFVRLERLPLTPNGKLDRRALLALEYNQAEWGSDFTPPRTPLERVLAETWKTILRVEQVGLNDHFFELGGHSSLAMQLIFRVSKDFRVDLPLQFLFEYPTLAEFSEALIARESSPGVVARIAQVRLKASAMPESERRMLLEAKRNG